MSKSPRARLVRAMVIPLGKEIELLLEMEESGNK
jgi:hypothetical protein